MGNIISLMHTPTKQKKNKKKKKVGGGGGGGEKKKKKKAHTDTHTSHVSWAVPAGACHSLAPLCLSCCTQRNPRQLMEIRNGPKIHRALGNADPVNGKGRALKIH